MKHEHIPAIHATHLYYIVTGEGPTMFVVGPKCRRLSNQYQPERPEVVEAHPDSVCLLLFVH